MALAIDASSPVIATNAVGTVTTVTSASFTPPTGSLLIVRWSGDSVTGVNPSTPTITDSLGTPLTYTLQDWASHADSPFADGQCAVWSAIVGTSAAMTVTVTSGSASGARESALAITVFTGQNLSSPIGAHGKSSSLSAASIVQSYTAQSSGGMGLIVDCDWDLKGAQTAGTGCTIVNGGSANIGTAITYGFFRRTIADDVNGGSNTLNVTIPTTSTNLSWAYIEVNPEPDASGSYAGAQQSIPFPLLFQLIELHAQRYAADPGVSTPEQTVVPVRIQSSDDSDSPSITLNINPNGISSTEQFGNANIASVSSVVPGGISTGEQFGSPTITTTVTVSPSGIPSSERFGAATVTSTVNVAVNGIVTNEQFGTATVSQAISASGIPSSERFGSPTITTTYTVNAGGIPSTEQFGSTNATTASSVFASGILSSEQFG